MYGIDYKGKHSYIDFGMTIKSRDINPPKKNKMKETIPYMQGSYDFSNLYGEQTYSERELIYVFNLTCHSKLELNTKKLIILDWLLNSFKTKLKDDIIPGYYFMAECEDLNFNEKGYSAEITVKFRAYPFKYGNENIGNEIWDDFNFEIDYMQNINYKVNGILSVVLYNPSSRKIVPTIICTSSIDIIQGETTYKFNSGATRDWRFQLSTGQNNLIIKGNGDIEFIFRKEVL